MLISHAIIYVLRNAFFMTARKEGSEKRWGGRGGQGELSKCRVTRAVIIFLGEV